MKKQISSARVVRFIFFQSQPCDSASSLEIKTPDCLDISVIGSLEHILSLTVDYCDSKWKWCSCLLCLTLRYCLFIYFSTSFQKCNNWRHLISFLLTWGSCWKMFDLLSICWSFGKTRLSFQSSMEITRALLDNCRSQAPRRTTSE